MNVTIISTINQHKDLYDLEFVRPIVDIIKETETELSIVHIRDLNEKNSGDKYIITGTSYQDNEFLTHKEKIQPLLASGKPILGICAGAELLLPENVALEEIKEIGPQVVEELHEDYLTKGLDGKECYFLHQNGIRTIPLDNKELVALLATPQGIAAFRYKDKPVCGVQFHPEVNHKDIIQRFVKL